MGYVGLPQGTKNQFHGKQLEIQSGLEKSMFMDMTVETRNVCECHFPCDIRGCCSFAGALKSYRSKLFFL